MLCTWNLSASFSSCRLFFNVEHFSGMHNWYACSHARPTFCNVCKDSLSGVTSHGLSCEGKPLPFPNSRWGK
uniref:Uncharacterized protein n=1 Tax=Oryzias sinensis TaxID=183150 RepID=A0A8C7Y5C6_9TELE